MNIRDLDFRSFDPRNIDIESALGHVGLRQRRSQTEEMMPLVGLFGVGFLVGAGVALLLAPRTGKEMRGEVANRLSQVPDMVSGIPQKVSQLAEQATGAFGTVGDAGQAQGTRAQQGGAQARNDSTGTTASGYGTQR